MDGVNDGVNVEGKNRKKKGSPLFPVNSGKLGKYERMETKVILTEKALGIIHNPEVGSSSLPRATGILRKASV